MSDFSQPFPKGDARDFSTAVLPEYTEFMRLRQERRGTKDFNNARRNLENKIVELNLGAKYCVIWYIGAFPVGYIVFKNVKPLLALVDIKTGRRLTEANYFDTAFSDASKVPFRGAVKVQKRFTDGQIGEGFLEISTGREVLPIKPGFGYYQTLPPRQYCLVPQETYMVDAPSYNAHLYRIDKGGFSKLFSDSDMDNELDVHGNLFSYRTFIEQKGKTKWFDYFLKDANGSILLQLSNYNKPVKFRFLKFTYHSRYRNDDKPTAVVNILGVGTEEKYYIYDCLEGTQIGEFDSEALALAWINESYPSRKIPIQDSIIDYKSMGIESVFSK